MRALGRWAGGAPSSVHRSLPGPRHLSVGRAAFAGPPSRTLGGEADVRRVAGGMATCADRAVGSSRVDAPEWPSWHPLDAPGDRDVRSTLEPVRRSADLPSSARYRIAEHALDIAPPPLAG